MATPHAQQKLAPSILDRLIDDDPGRSSDADPSRAQVLRTLRNNVRRDLENLLNSHLPWPEIPKALTEVSHSILNYGLPNFNTLGVSSQEQRQDFAKVIEDTIVRFETRLRNVSVTAIENSDSADRTLRLRIQALLYVEPEIEPIAFQSMLEPASQAMIIQDEYHHG